MLELMRYEIISIGQTKKGFYKEGCDFYRKRLQGYTNLTLKELKVGKAVSSKVDESEALIKAANGYLIALDEEGKHLSSAMIAKEITRLELSSISLISFLIGGADGHSESLKKQASELWRLSDLTLAHDLAKLLLLEQLYRAETIRAGHPYHRE